MSNAIVKNLNFGSDAKNNVFAGITSQIQKQITPVDENLYFTWQNPPVPPVPPVEE